MQLYYREYQPSEALKPFVHCLWSITFDSTSNEVTPVQRCFPSGCIELIVQSRGPLLRGLQNDHWFDYPRAVLTGVCDYATTWVAHHGSETIGVRFTPEGAIRLFNPPLKEYRNNSLDAELLLGKRISSIIDRLEDCKSMKEQVVVMETFLKDQVKQVTLEQTYFTEALRLIRQSDDLNIGDLSKKVYVCDRQLQRSFQNHMGISPKTYHKVMRLYKSFRLGLMRQQSYTDIAYEAGYSDSAHFTREFKNYFGSSPELYFNTTGLQVVS